LTRIVLYALLAAGCEREVAPLETRDASRPLAARERAVETPETQPEPAVSNSSTDTDAPPPPRGMDVPSPTTGKSSADSTRSPDEQPTLNAVRIGQSSGSDRLVFEFDGEGLPAWTVEYVDQPETDCGSGEAVPVAGEASLQIRFVGARAHSDAGEGTSGSRRRAVGHRALRELVRSCDFEGHVTWVAGVAGPNPYTPRVLASPSRLVIDIAH